MTPSGLCREARQIAERISRRQNQRMAPGAAGVTANEGCPSSWLVVCLTEGYLTLEVPTLEGIQPVGPGGHRAGVHIGEAGSPLFASLGVAPVTLMSLVVIFNLFSFGLVKIKLFRKKV